MAVLSNGRLRDNGRLPCRLRPHKPELRPREYSRGDTQGELWTGLARRFGLAIRSITRHRSRYPAAQGARLRTNPAERSVVASLTDPCADGHNCGP